MTVGGLGMAAAVMDSGLRRNGGKEGRNDGWGVGNGGGGYGFRLAPEWR